MRAAANQNRFKAWQLLWLKTTRAGVSLCFAITTTAPIREGTIIVYFAVGLLTHCRRTLTAFSFTIGEQWPGKKTSTCKPKFAAIHSGWSVPALYRSSLFMDRASSPTHHHERPRLYRGRLCCQSFRRAGAIATRRAPHRGLQALLEAAFNESDREHRSPRRCLVRTRASRSIATTDWLTK